MNKKGSVVFFAVLLSCLFSLGYVLIFMFLQAGTGPTLTLSMNQIGIYQSRENADALVDVLIGLDLKPYIYQKAEMNIVVTSFYEDATLTKAEQKILEEARLSYIYKEIESNDKAIVEAFENGDYVQVLEMMSHKSNGNE